MREKERDTEPDPLRRTKGGGGRCGALAGKNSGANTQRQQTYHRDIANADLVEVVHRDGSSARKGVGVVFYDELRTVGVRAESLRR